MTLRLQLALDGELPESLALVQQTADLVDVIEVGTLLILREGMRAVSLVRSLAPAHPVLADVRIAEAGGPISTLAFDAGADWVSMVGAASDPTVAEVCRVAAERGGEVQIELAALDSARLQSVRDAGVVHAIVHRSRDGAQDTWTATQLTRIDEVADLGFQVTVTGGVSLDDIPVLARTRADIVIVGRAIAGAESPRAAAQAFRAAIDGA